MIRSDCQHHFHRLQPLPSALAASLTGDLRSHFPRQAAARVCSCGNGQSWWASISCLCVCICTSALCVWRCVFLTKLTQADWLLIGCLHRCLYTMWHYGREGKKSHTQLREPLHWGDFLCGKENVSTQSEAYANTKYI